MSAHGKAALSATVPSVVTMLFEQIGWEIHEVDINLATGKAAMRIFRNDGRWIHLAADTGGRSTVERWQREVTIERGARVICDRFLGRMSCFGARSALRSVCDYLAENPAPGRAALPTSGVRDAVRMLMSAEGQS